MTEYQKLEKLIFDARALIEKQVTNDQFDMILRDSQTELYM